MISPGNNLDITNKSGDITNDGEPSLIAKLAYNFVDYSLWMFMVEISIVCGAFTANITGRHLE